MNQEEKPSEITKFEDSQGTLSEKEALEEVGMMRNRLEEYKKAGKFGNWTRSDYESASNYISNLKRRAEYTITDKIKDFITSVFGKDIDKMYLEMNIALIEEAKKELESLKDSGQ